MKKLSAIIISLFLLAPSIAEARRSEFFYVTSSFGYLRLQDISGAKSLNNKYFDLGVGNYLTDSIRLELVYEHYLDPRNRRSDRDANGPVLEVYRHKMNNLLFSAYVDFMKFDSFSLFAGAGIGVSQFKSEVDIKRKASDGSDIKKSGLTKKRYNLTYAVHAGFFMEIADEMYLYPKYSWRGFGSTKPYTRGGEEIADSKSLNGHTLSVGIRVDI